MTNKCLVLLFFVSICLIQPVLADGYMVHCNVEGAEVVVGEEVIGTVQNNVLYVPWHYGNDFPFMAIKAEGYLEEWDKLDQPWPGEPEDVYYRLQPEDSTVMNDGDLRVIVQPAGLNYVYYRDLSPDAVEAGISNDWVFYGDVYGSEFVMHYLPAGKKEIKVERRNFEDVIMQATVYGNTQTDVSLGEMVRTKYLEEIDAAGHGEIKQAEAVAQRQTSFLVIETSTPEPVVTVAENQITPVKESKKSFQEVEEEMDGENGINIIGVFVLMGFVGAFLSGGYFLYSKMEFY